VSQQHDAIRGALGALRPEDEHPGHEMLEAYVEGRLTPDERAEIDRIAARSPVVAEDLADLQSVHTTLVAQPAARGNVRWGRMAAMTAVAAGVMLAIWISGARRQPPTPVVSSEEAQRVTLAIASGHVQLPQKIAALRAVDGALLGAAEPAVFRLQTPVGSAVLYTRPSFTWDDAAATSYTVSVFDQNFSEITRGESKTTSWRPDVDLPRGGTYSWQVTAHRGGENITEPRPPRPEARFTVIDGPTAARIMQIEARLSSEPLALGVVLAEEGLVVDARAQFARAANEHPEIADIARQLYRSLDQGTPITTKPAQ
jgi:hypothetical protein